MISHKFKLFLFKRGGLPMGDYRDLYDKVRERKGDIYNSPPVKEKFIVSFFDTNVEENKKKNDERYEQALQEWKDKCFESFLHVLEKEGEAQWDRIVDRRAANWIYVLLGTLLGFLLGLAV